MNLTSLLLAAQIVRKDEIDIPMVEVGGDNFTTAFQMALGVAGAIAFLIIVLGGFKYVISQGNPQETAKAKDTIMYALIGLMICIAAFAIIEFVVKGVT